MLVQVETLFFYFPLLNVPVLVCIVVLVMLIQSYFYVLYVIEMLYERHSK